jgi:glyoxylase-like metal-dependent hydrolase (beta-lactamase superfamily II)
MGAKPFKTAGATIVGHRRAKERLDALKNPDTPSPDEVVDDKRVIELGGTVLELHYTGRNHSDSSLVMFLPKEKIIFAVDFNTIGTPSRLAVNDSYPEEWQESLKRTLALGWDRQITGHPGPGGRPLSTRADMEQQLAFMNELSAEVKKASDAGKCFDPAVKEVRPPSFKDFGNLEQNIEWNVHRWCGYWGRGI